MVTAITILSIFILLSLSTTNIVSFTHPLVFRKRIHISSLSSTTTPQEQPQAQPRTGFLQGLLDIALNSQIWKLVLVPLARQKIVDTGEANGIPWTNAYNWIQSQNGPWKDNIQYDVSHVPSYYKKSFHAYDDGNLCWDAALEQEIAGRAVGARNFPSLWMKPGLTKNGKRVFTREVANSDVLLDMSKHKFILMFLCVVSWSSMNVYVSKFGKLAGNLGVCTHCRVVPGPFGTIQSKNTDRSGRNSTCTKSS